MKIQLTNCTAHVPALTLNAGECFRRPESKDGNRSLYMRVEVLNQVNWQSRSSERTVPVVNLGTGSFWCISPEEQVIRCPYAIVLEKP